MCVTAAVENGADAVYFGLECGFNARVARDQFAPRHVARSHGLPARGAYGLRRAQYAHLSL